MCAVRRSRLFALHAVCIVDRATEEASAQRCSGGYDLFIVALFAAEQLLFIVCKRRMLRMRNKEINL